MHLVRTFFLVRPDCREEWTPLLQPHVSEKNGCVVALGSVAGMQSTQVASLKADIVHCQDFMVCFLLFPLLLNKKHQESQGQEWHGRAREENKRKIKRQADWKRLGGRHSGEKGREREGRESRREPSLMLRHLSVAVLAVSKTFRHGVALLFTSALTGELLLGHMCV